MGRVIARQALRAFARHAKGSEVHMQISFPREQQLTFDNSGVDFPGNCGRSPNPLQDFTRGPGRSLQR